MNRIYISWTVAVTTFAVAVFLWLNWRREAANLRDRLSVSKESVRLDREISLHSHRSTLRPQIDRLQRRIEAEREALREAKVWFRPRSGAVGRRGGRHDDVTTTTTTTTTTTPARTRPARKRPPRPRSPRPQRLPSQKPRRTPLRPRRLPSRKPTGPPLRPRRLPSRKPRRPLRPRPLRQRPRTRVTL